MATVDFINIVNGNATCNIESTQGIVLERITFIIKIKSKENSFINRDSNHSTRGLINITWMTLACKF